jgi:four helix bundle protein
VAGNERAEGCCTVKGDDIAERLLDFAVRVTRLVSALPKNTVGRHISGQLVRCGTSAGANYEEARGAESRADFIHKLGVAWKEIRESCYWVRIIQRAQLLPSNRLQDLLQEGEQLCAILASSLATVKKRSEGHS